jgi:SAM-dependent methyltransferase
VSKDNNVIRDFGDEWERFNFLDEDKLQSLKEQFDRYMAPLPEELRKRDDLIIADFGAGTGRWSYFLKDFAVRIYAVEPAEKAFRVLTSRFRDDSKVVLLHESVESNQIPNNSLDLAVSLGVLHHIADTQGAIQKVAEKIKPGGTFLGYLYYALENKPFLYRALWRLSDFIRKVISRLPKKFKLVLADFIALIIYLPLATISRILEKFRISVDSVPLHHYKDLSFHVMRNDALDRFGTTLEQRFTQAEIVQMLTSAGLTQESVRFSKGEPFWTFSAKKSN